jgi:hypothetical protein
MSRTVKVEGAKPPNLPVLGVVPTLTGRVNPVRFAAYKIRYSGERRIREEEVEEKEETRRYRRRKVGGALVKERRREKKRER